MKVPTWKKCSVCTVRKKGADDFTDQILELSMDVAKRLPDYMKSPEEYAVVLTPTEKKVLKLMVDGLSYEQIGEKLNKKVGTVKVSHFRDIPETGCEKQTAGSETGCSD